MRTVSTRQDTGGVSRDDGDDDYDDGDNKSTKTIMAAAEALALDERVGLYRGASSLACAYSDTLLRACGTCRPGASPDESVAVAVARDVLHAVLEAAGQMQALARRPSTAPVTRRVLEAAGAECAATARVLIPAVAAAAGKPRWQQQQLAGITQQAPCTALVLDCGVSREASETDAVAACARRRRARP
ncbi:hypothetical protein HK405_001589, partial [Cladochytrium tenue]